MRSSVGVAFVQLELFSLRDVGAPSSEPNVRYVGQWRKGPELVVQLEIILDLQGIGEETMWSPGDRPFGGHGGAGCQCLLDDGVIDRIAIEQGRIRRQDLPVEFGTEDSALELLRVVVPVP